MMRGSTLLLPFSIAYGAAARLRARLFHRRMLKSRRLPITVVSVGNLTVGGSGKTPVVISLARYLKERGERVVILSRGYKGRLSKEGGLVSDGSAVFLTARDAGDEPVMMARSLSGVAVVVGRNRYRAGLFALHRLKPRVAILDDGYQHIALARDLNILVLDRPTLDPSNRLLPAGTLREPLTALGRADLILLREGVGPEGHNELERMLSRLERKVPVIPVSFAASHLRDLSGERVLPPEALKGKKVIALSAIARPQRFHEMLAGLGAVVEGVLSFRDHHLYSDKDYRTIKGAARGCDLVVTTAKDAVRLEAGRLDGVDLVVLEIGVEFGPRFEEIATLLDDALGRA